MPKGQASHPVEGTYTIPVKYRAILKQHGYNGPWTVSEKQMNALLEKIKGWQDSGGNNPNDQAIQNLTDAINNALSGGGGSGGSAGMTQKQKDNLRNSYMDLLHRWRLDMDKNLQNLIEQGVKGEWSTISFMNHLRQTQEYKDQFPGIKGSPFQGTGDEGAYLHARDQYRELAQNIGRHITNDQFGALIKHGVTLDEWKVRMSYAERIDSLRPFFAQIEAVAKARGLIKPNAKFTEKDLYNLMLKRGDPVIQKLVGEANIRTELAGIGFTVGAHGDIQRQAVLRIMSSLSGQGGLGVAATLDPRYFSKLAQDVQTYIPAAEQIGAGLSKHQLFLMEFGTQDQKVEIARHAEAVLASYKEMDAHKQQEALVATQTGAQLFGAGTPKTPEGA